MEEKGARPLQSISSNESRPINDTLMNRLLVLGTVKVFGHLRRRKGGVLFVSSRICIKVRRGTLLSEASTVRFIARRTSIPVPKIYCAFTHGGHTYIAMEIIKGDMLAVDWDQRSASSKEKLLSQLRTMVNEMRTIPCPGSGTISNVDGGPMFDVRFPHNDTHGPFENVHEFHSHFRNGFEADPGHCAEISEMIALQDGREWQVKFTHGDLSSLNILVRGDDIVGIIDWETAGFYPEYWEYTTASQVNHRNQFWENEIDKFLQPMKEAKEMDRIRLKYFGDITHFS